jgi:hypothetical protein
VLCASETREVNNIVHIVERRRERCKVKKIRADDFDGKIFQPGERAARGTDEATNSFSGGKELLDRMTSDESCSPRDEYCSDTSSFTIVPVSLTFVHYKSIFKKVLTINVGHREGEFLFLAT